jgi:hypothetical protein
MAEPAAADQCQRNRTSIQHAGNAGNSPSQQQPRCLCFDYPNGYLASKAVAGTDSVDAEAGDAAAENDSHAAVDTNEMLSWFAAALMIR